jgi:hypothetical protein
MRQDCGLRFLETYDSAIESGMLENHKSIVRRTAQKIVDVALAVAKTGVNKLIGFALMKPARSMVSYDAAI